ncbi:SwmB domain-containing protein [Planktomarina temperata]|nr:SwmB domain-containing protein [Planktomarina temperata]
MSSLTKSIDNDEITLTLPNYLLNNQSIYVSYTKNSTASKQLSDGANVVASVSGQGVTLTNDATTPAVLSVTTSKSDGSYKASDTVDVSVQFSEVVAVTGTPTLTLETGATDRTVDYASGTGSDTLVFTYTVQSGDTSSDLTYASTASLAGTIKDLAGSSAVLTLPEIGAASALGYSSAIVVDTAAPYIISRVSEGGSTSLTLRFTEVVSGAPDGSDFAVVVDSASVTVTTFSLSADGLSATLTLASAVGSSSTVTLDYTQSATVSKQLKDAAGNAIASIGDPVSVAVSRPTVTSILSDKASGSYAAGETIDIQLGLTEVVTVDTTSGTPTLKLELGATDRTASYQSGTGTNELTFRYVVQAGDLSSDLDYHATDPFKLNSGTIKDGDGNNVITTLPTAGSAGSLSSVEAIIIDASPPTISSVAANAGTKTVTLTMSEAVTGSPANGDFSVLVGSATNAATAVSVSGTSVTLTVTNVIANDATVTVGYTQNSTSSSQMKDTAGNAVATLSTAKSVTVTNDATAPTISSVTSSSTDATYKIGDIVNVQTVFSEAVTVTTASGTPQLTLETGTSDRAVSYSSGSGTDTLVFAYTVQSSDVSSDLDYKGTTSLALNNGTIKDLAGNTATITLNDPAAALTTNSLADSKAIVIDGVLPTISSVAANAGTKTVTLTMSEAVTGSPANGDFSVLVGSATNAATAVSVSGTSVTLTVTNVIANDATVTVGYTQNSTSSSQMKDTAGNAVATLSTAKSVTVTNDATAPTISSVTSSSTDATYKIGDIVNVQTVFSEAVTVTTASGTPQLTLETGTSDRAVSYTSGSGTDTLVFAYTVQSTDVSSDLDYKGTTSLALNNGTIKDLAGNTATITLNDPAAALTTNSLADSKAIVIDGVLPTISSAAADGGSANVVLTMSEVVTGAPDTSDFTVLVGGSAKTVSGISDVSSATNSITLTLASVVPNDSIVTVDYDQNSSAAKKLSDGAGNNVATVGTPETVTVTDDNISPTVASVTGTNGTYDLASPTVDLTVKFSEPVNVQGTPTLQLETGTTDQKALYVSGTGSTDLLFRYTVQSGDGSGDLNYLSNTSLTFGTDGMIKDDALNTADLSLGSIASLAFASDIIVSGV